MTTADDLLFSKAQKAVLDSVLPGGTNWRKFRDTGKTCLMKCPYFQPCKGWGPEKICSSNWKKAELTPEVISVLLHVANNFDHYDRGDTSKEKIRKGLVESIRKVVYDWDTSQLSQEFCEGNPKMRMHLYRERNTAIAIKFKRDALKRGALKCEVCEKDYLALFGELAATRMVECHHTVPLSSKAHGGKTYLKDLVLLCANCHRLAHSKARPISVLALKKKVRKKN